MAALLQTLRLFVERDLRDVVVWNDVLVSNPASDHLRAQINGKKGRYALEVRSYFSVPPLGEIVLRDDAGTELVRDKNQPVGWHAVAMAIKAREGVGDQVPAAKVAEASRPASEVTTLALPSRAALSYDDALHHSPLVYYLAQRGEHYHCGPAVVTRVYADGALDLVTFPADCEPVPRTRVQPKGETPNTSHNCWTHYESGMRAEMDDLRAEMAALKTQMAELLEVATKPTKAAKTAAA